MWKGQCQSICVAIAVFSALTTCSHIGHLVGSRGRNSRSPLIAAYAYIICVYDTFQRVGIGPLLVDSFWEPFDYSFELDRLY